MAASSVFDQVFSFPYNAKEIRNAGGAIIDYDRKFDANDFAQDRAVFLSDGVFVSPADNFFVSAATGLTLSVGAESGLNAAFITGHSFVAKGRQEIDVPAAHDTYPRKDIVTLRHSNLSEHRDIRLLYIAGTPSQAPEPPELVRNADGYEIKLAEVTVPAGAQEIRQANILDTRLDQEQCGIVACLGLPIDVSVIFRQYQDYLDTQMADWNATKAQQAADWLAQLTGQKNAYADWFGGAQTDIRLISAFVFDALEMIPGTTKNTVFNADGSITEKLIMDSDGRNVAQRITTFDGDGNISSAFTLWQEDGTTVQLSTNTDTAFHADGSFTDKTIIRM